MRPAHRRETWDGGCYVELAGDDTRRTTYCEGTTCHCLEDGVPVCGCETDVLWCETPSRSRCPAPWP
ncbi:MAG: hypothetical protein KC731_38810 [Myxococcales bacterium]|nr:hypothetical protein [Myxococcales bacterium]